LDFSSILIIQGYNDRMCLSRQNSYLRFAKATLYAEINKFTVILYHKPRQIATKIENFQLLLYSKSKAQKTTLYCHFLSPAHTGGDNSISSRYIPTAISRGSWPIHNESAFKNVYNNSVFIIPQNLSDFNIWTGFSENFVKVQSVDL